MGHADELKQMLVDVFTVLNDKEFAESVAKMYHNLFQALIKEGFSSEQALKIVSSMNFTK